MCRDDRHRHRDGCAGLVRLDFEAAALFADTFTHACQADADVGSGLKEVGEQFAGHAFTVIADAENGAGRRGVQRDCSARAFGVAMDVGERFLENTEEHEFGGARQAAHVIGNIGDQFDAAAFGEAFGVPARGGSEANFVEERRMEKVRDGARLGDRFGKELIDFGKKFIVGIFLSQNGHVHLGECEELAQAVVEFAGEFAALFILELENADAETARAFLAAFARGELVAEQAEVNPEEEDGENEHRQQDAQQEDKEIVGEGLALAEEMLFLGHHFLHDVAEVGGGSDVVATQTKLRAVVERAGLAQLDGGIRELYAAKNIVFELGTQRALDGIVFGELANAIEFLVNLAFERAIRSELRHIAGIQEESASASGAGEARLNVTEGDLDVVAMFGPRGGMQKANDGDGSGDPADQKKD